MTGGRASRPRGRAIGRLVRAAAFPPAVLLLAGVGMQAQSLPYASMAARIVSALQVTRGERAILRYDPDTMPALLAETRRALEAAGAIVDSLEYGPVAGFGEMLARTDIYVWLPTGVATPPDQVEALGRWLDAARGRQVHFHWGDGTRSPDGLPAPHASAYDRVYVEALDADYAAMRAAMDRVIDLLRSGEVHVRTPAGTDLRFRVGDRPFNRQAGDASKAAMASARTRIDREIELPAGVLRVAPLEDSVTGTIVVPSARFGERTATGVRLAIDRGRVERATAATGADALETFLESAAGARHFREFGLGFNPRLVIPPGQRALPYYGYGAGVVRLSLGDNSELGGAVRGGGVRWLFFPDATVTVGATAIVQEGVLDVR